jgi:hypothetical protein
MTLFLLFSLSYASTAASYDSTALQTDVMESIYEDLKEDAKTDNTVDKLDILLTYILYMNSCDQRNRPMHLVGHYSFYCENTLYKPPLFS